MRSLPICFLGFLSLPYLICQAKESLPPLVNETAPQSLGEMWAGFDPQAEPLEVEVLKEWEEENVILRVLRYRIGIFKGQKAMMAAIYGYPKGAMSLPGLLQIHGGGQYADYRAVLTNAKRGYATISIAWAGRIHAPDYNVTPKEVKLFWDDARDHPNYKVTTDWGPLDAYHAPCRNPRNAFAHVSPAEWTLDEVDSPRNNPWFLCTLGARRAITFLEEQSEVNRKKLGVYGHSMGGKLAVMTAAADKRIKAAAPSCGGISNRSTDIPLYNNTIADDVNLQHIECPIIFLSPSNDFHGRLNDLPKAVNEIASQEWRVTCSPHSNHQDTAEYQIAGLLWFDQQLKKTFRFPRTPITELTLKTEARTPTIRVTPDTSREILSVSIYYTQHGKLGGEKNNHDNTKNRFWRSAKTSKEGDTWTANLRLTSTSKPLWAYANVLYAIDAPQTGAGYYYGLYTAESVNLSSVVHLVRPEQLLTAGILASIEPTTLIESFEGDWEKEWFTYKPEEWARSTHKVYDEQWAAPENGALAFEVRSEKANRLVVGIDQHATEVELTGQSKWQPITLTPANFTDAAGSPLTRWEGIKELRLGAKETLRLRGNGQDQKRTVGANWSGNRPEFSNLRWVAQP